nr:ArsR family transcriptional regulator [Gluconacetobacter asukensis]
MALSSEVRMTILRLLADPARHFADQWSADPVEFGVCMKLIARALKIAQPTVSRHLDILKQADFIIIRKREKWSHCKRNEPAIRDYLDWLSQELKAA